MSKIALRRYNVEISDMIDQNQIDGAIAHCHHILNSYPKYVETYRLLGKAYLEAKQFENASDVFQRVLSSHPDDFISNIGMSIISEDVEDYDAAIHYMERSFEEQPSNNALQEEMKRLFGLRDGVEPTKIRLTRGALAKMYVHGNLYDQAVAELLSIINESPKRLDLSTILAETYFIQNMNTEAAEVCMQIINDLPYSYLANRIMYIILVQDDREDQAQEYLKRWVELDPYAEFVTLPSYKSEDIPDNTLEIERLDQEVFGEPIEEKLEISDDVEIQETGIDDDIKETMTALDEMSEGAKSVESVEEIDVGDEIPDWLFDGDVNIGEEESVEETVEEETVEEENFDSLFGVGEIDKQTKLAEAAPEAGEADIIDEIIDEKIFEVETEDSDDDWLENLEKATKTEDDSLSSLVESDEQLFEKSESLELDDDEEPDWLSDIVEDKQTEEKLDWDMIADTIPSQTLDESELSEIQEEDEKTAEVEETDDDSIPDWLSSIEETEEELETAEAVEEASVESDEAIPDWLASVEENLEEPEIDEVVSDEVEKTIIVEDDETPDWLSSIEEVQEAVEVEEVVNEESEEELLPDVLTDDVAEVEDAETDEEVDSVTDIETDEGVPDWLMSEIEEVEEDEEAVEEIAPTALFEKEVEDILEEQTETNEDEKIEEAADEAWRETLSETQQIGISDNVEMPDWLKKIETEQVDSSSSEKISDEEVNEINSLPEDDLPDWLKELKEEEFGERSVVDALLSEEEDIEEPDIEDVSGSSELIGEIESEPELEMQHESQPEEDLIEEPLAETISEEEDIFPDSESLIDEEPYEREIPDWMKALDGIADDVSGDGVVKNVTEMLSPQPEVEEVEEIAEEIEEKIEDEVSEFFSGADDDLLSEELEIDDEPEVIEELEIEDEPEVAVDPIVESEITPSEDSDWIPELEIEESGSEPIQVEEEVEVVELEEQPVVESLDDVLEEIKELLKSRDINSATGLLMKLIRKNKNLPAIIELIEESLIDHPLNSVLWQLLGDAFMKVDKLSEAMDAYTNAEELLR